MTNKMMVRLIKSLYTALIVLVSVAWAAYVWFVVMPIEPGIAKPLLALYAAGWLWTALVWMRYTP